jgi:hypothetical protein
MNTRKTFGKITARLSVFLFAVLLAGCASSRKYPGPVHGQTFNGTIKAIGLNEHRLTVTPLKPGEPGVFVWDDSTKFWKKGVPIKPEQLESTWPVRIHYHTASGQSIAHHVYVELTYPIVR